MYEDITSTKHVDAKSGKALSCEREENNNQDPYAVVVIRHGIIVGRVPRKITVACSLFLRRGGTINCKITEARRFSGDPQGGLEVPPCKVTFKGNPKNMRKLKKLLKSPAFSSAATNITNMEQPRKKRSVNQINEDVVTENYNVTVPSTNIWDCHQMSEYS